MKKLKFFREATLRICGNLKIEEALQECLVYLKDFLPVERLNLHRFDPNFGTMHAVCMVTTSERTPFDVLIPISKEAKKTLRLQVKQSDPDVRIFNDPDSVALCREMLHFFNLSCECSLMVMRLRLHDEILGSLVLMSSDHTLYTEEHAALLSELMIPFATALSNTIFHREVLKLNDQLKDENRYLYSELRKLSGEEIIGANFGLKNVMLKVRQVANLDSPVLLQGETGVGKDLIANMVHSLSERKNKPFISVNCGAIPDSLIDSELFGHEKGSFTGALSQKYGRFERANKGTIFLDEIGELPPQAQVRLLRVLQTKEIERVGGTETVKLDIRIIAATNRNLEEMVKTNQFREDLWFRLNVFPIWIPPVRDRSADIPALVRHFIELKSKELKLPAIPKTTADAIDHLMDYHWPGNVRELQNMVERALILNPEGPLSFDILPGHKKQKIASFSEKEHDVLNIDKVMIQHIQKVLAKTSGKIHGPEGAAELLGINPSTLRHRIKKLGIEKYIKE